MIPHNRFKSFGFKKYTSILDHKGYFPGFLKGFENKLGIKDYSKLHSFPDMNE